MGSAIMPAVGMRDRRPSHFALLVELTVVWEVQIVRWGHESSYYYELLHGPETECVRRLSEGDPQER